MNFDGEADTLVNTAQISIGMNAGLDSIAQVGCYGGLQSGDFSACTHNTTLASATYPAQIPVFADSVAIDPNPDPTVYNLGIIAFAAFPPNVSGGLTDRHSQGTNIGLLDGHVKWYRTKAVLANVTLPDFSNFAQNLPCQNYNTAHLYWDPTAPDPTSIPTCPTQSP
jgi:prepilin-type processing-associated H-X9-DG protein